MQDTTSPRVTAANSDGEVEQDGFGIWHLTGCAILFSGTVDGLEAASGDLPCNCDQAHALSLAPADPPKPTWTDALAKLAQFASDHELARPLTIAHADDDWLSISVSGPDHAAWFAHFGRGHEPVHHPGTVMHDSWGELPSGIHVSLRCLSDGAMRSTVAVR